MMSELNMDYNSDRSGLIIPEYGRNVQNLVAEGKKIEDREKRQAFFEKLIELIMQMHPQNKNLEDYRIKVWGDVVKIAGFELDVELPEGTPTTPEETQKIPEHVGYPKAESRFRHYGHNVQKLIAKAKGMEDGPIKEGFVETIGNYMKLAYRTWNKEHYVSDEVIFSDLVSLSDGELALKENTSLDVLTQRNRSGNSGGKGRKRHQNSSHGKSGRDKKYKRKRK